MKNVLSLLKIVVVVSLSFVLLAFSLISVLTHVYAVSARSSSTAHLLTTPTPTHKHKHKRADPPTPIPTTQAVVTPTAIAVVTTTDSKPSTAPTFPSMFALLSVLISAGSALLLSLLFLHIARRKTERNSLPLVESQETVPFNDTTLPITDAPAPTNGPQISFNETFLADTRNLPSR